MELYILCLFSDTTIQILSYYEILEILCYFQQTNALYGVNGHGGLAIGPV